ncbi:MAG: SCO1664 family protein [Acidimicrobiia bacterium]
MSETELTDDDVARALSTGTVEVIGRMPWSSNATLLVECVLDEFTVRAVYKPHAGERPLWDFPDGLWRREIAAYELSVALGWDLVPMTIAREDAPHGIGSLQLLIEADYDQHYFTLLEDERHHRQFRRMAAFDFVANNTDRKSGHCLVDADGHVWGIDNGLSFHADFKLRTVIWDFADEPIYDDDLTDLARLADEPLPAALADLLGPFERDAVVARAQALVRNGVLPADPSGRRWPWPLV